MRRTESEKRKQQMYCTQEKHNKRGGSGRRPITRHTLRCFVTAWWATPRTQHRHRLPRRRRWGRGIVAAPQRAVIVSCVAVLAWMAVRMLSRSCLRLRATWWRCSFSSRAHHSSSRSSLHISQFASTRPLWTPPHSCQSSCLEPTSGPAFLPPGACTET